MKVILDSNVLCADFRLEGGAFKTLFQSLVRIGGTCCLPELVVEEVLSNQRRRRAEIEQKLIKVEEKWRQVTGCRPETVAGRLPTAPDYPEYLGAKLKEHGVEIAPYPDVAHKALVERATTRRKPFKQSGSGYRDALIWHSILALIDQGDEHICLVTANSKDFGVAPMLHSELQKEVKSGTTVEIFNSLESFNAAKILPALERLGDMMRRLEQGNFSAFSLDRWVQGNIKAVLNDEEHSYCFVPIDYGHADVHVVELRGAEPAVIDDVRQLPSGDILLMGNVDLRVLVSVSPHSDFGESYSDVWEFFGGDLSGDPSANVEEEGNVAFTLTLKQKTYEVTCVEIDGLRTPAGYDIEINPHERREPAARHATSA